MKVLYSRIIIILFLGVVVFGGGVLSSSAFAGQLPDLVGKIFGSSGNRSPDPGKTLQAPFAEPENGRTQDEKDRSSTKRIDDLYYDEVTQNIDLSDAHRNEGQVSKWVTDAVARSLNIQPRSYKAHVQTLSKGTLSPSGVAQFRAFMNDTNMLAALNSRDWYLMPYVENAPILQNKGSLKGRYRWLFQVPVTVSFMPSGMMEYTKDSGVVTERLLVNVQVSRIDPSFNEIGLAIEAWTAKKNTN